MAIHNFLEALAQGLDVEFSLDARGRRNAIGGQAGFELVNKPEALLGERRREEERSSGHGSLSIAPGWSRSRRLRMKNGFQGGP